MNLCGACDRLARAISRREWVWDQYHKETLELLRSERTCRLCSFICSSSVCEDFKGESYSTLRSVITNHEKDFDDRYFITYTLFPSCILCSFTILTPHSELRCEIFLSADLGSPAASAGWPPTPTLRPNSSTDEYYALIRSWLDMCLKHGECKKGVSGNVINEDSGPELPKRVIEIKSSPTTPLLRLLETRGLHGQYVALSHCWGPPDKRPLSTTTNNFKSFLQEISFEYLPRTFQDAVALTCGIGLQYLWIDSLCIIQDSEEDWRKESANMGAIYENATLTIGAASAENSTEGLFMPIRRRQAPVTIPYNDDYSGEVSRGHLIVEERFGCSSFFEPLRKRGWVVQERRLSRRQVLSTRGGLSWKCQRGCQDQFGLGVDNQDYPEWHSLLGYYSECELTYASDRLIALEGLVNTMKRIRQDSYHYGIWHTEAVLHILWMRNIYGPSDENLSHIPSWSWASKSGPKTFWAYGNDFEDDADTSWHTPDMITINDSGVMTITDAPVMSCRVVDHRNFDRTGKNIGLAVDTFCETRCEPLSYIQVLHGDVQKTVGVAALDDESCRPSCCISLMRCNAREWVPFPLSAKSHNDYEMMLPKDTGHENLENYNSESIHIVEKEDEVDDISECEESCKYNERLASEGTSDDLVDRKDDFIEETDDTPMVEDQMDFYDTEEIDKYWHIVLMLQPANQGVDHFNRVGMGFIPESYWESGEVRYTQVHLV